MSTTRRVLYESLGHNQTLLSSQEVWLLWYQLLHWCYLFLHIRVRVHKLYHFLFTLFIVSLLFQQHFILYIFYTLTLTTINYNEAFRLSVQGNRRPMSFSLYNIYYHRHRSYHNNYCKIRLVVPRVLQSCWASFCVCHEW